MSKKRLGEVLVERECLSEEALQQALQAQGKKATRLAELLFQSAMVPKQDLVSALEEVTGLRYREAGSCAVEEAALRLIPRETAQRYCTLPVAVRNRELVVIMAEPQNLQAIDDLRFLTGMGIVPWFGFLTEIQEAGGRHYGELERRGLGGEGQKALAFADQWETGELQFLSAGPKQNGQGGPEQSESELRDEHTPVVRLASAILQAAAAKGASDVHIEPQAEGSLVRIRVDGMLRELTYVPRELQTSLASRIKILADMDIAERRQPQDGRFQARLGSRKLDIRVSTLPAHYGEKVVLRLLDPDFVRVTFTDLGMSPLYAEKLRKLLSMPQGMILVTGPTGSGKTTLLYAALNALRAPHLNIVTVEDPIEYRLEDVTQVQVNPKAGLTFASCLRAILRQDPNVIMVGEIRDAETAEIALQAAQTGHLVLSTLHTNDSISAVPRLLDLHVPAYLIGPAISGVTAQRLVRKLCKCRKEVTLAPDDPLRGAAAGLVDFDGKLFARVGCEACDYTGYMGRQGIYEMLVFDDEIRESVREKARAETLRSVALRRGMKTMQEDALDKMKQGVTTAEEVMRIVPFTDHTGAACVNCTMELAPTFLFCPYCGAASRQAATAACAGGTSQ